MRLSRTRADSGAQGYTASVVTVDEGSEGRWLRPLEVVTLVVVVLVVLISGGRVVWF